MRPLYLTLIWSYSKFQSRFLKGYIDRELRKFNNDLQNWEKIVTKNIFIDLNQYKLIINNAKE